MGWSNRNADSSGERAASAAGGATKDRPEAEPRQRTVAKPQRPGPGNRMARRVVTTLIAWLVAYLIVTIVFVAGGFWLAGAPMPVRLLVVSGVLVIVMVNVLMPAMSRLIGKLFGPRN
jgi:antibiotic biosynthesis monooxygenase (ABM) superfamily enzyme